MEKNFLETINNDYPSSFAEEKFVGVKKSKKGIIITIIAILLLLSIGLIIYFKLNKKITMKNFIGETKETLNIWLKENDINSKNVIITSAYDPNYDENYIIDQSISEGEEFKKGKVISFTVSKGADPDELIKFPDIKSMTYDEIKKWITDNKLTNVKVTQEYSNEIKKDNVISYKLKNIEEKEYKRASNLSIVISKGEKPKNEIVMENFVGKSTEAIVLFANTNKIELNVTNVFSSNEAGLITYQSVPAGTKIYEGDKVSISVSKGQGVNVPSFVSKSKSDVVAWASSNDILLSLNEVYSQTPKNKIIEQSIAPNSQVGAGDTIVITVSLGMPYLDNYRGLDINELLEWINEANSKGCSINLEIEDKKYYSDNIKKDGIINQSKNGYISLNENIKVTLSSGAKILVDKDYIGLKEEDIKLFCTQLNCIFDYQKSNLPIGTVIDVLVNNNKLKPDVYINSSDTVLVTISEGV